MISTSMPEGDSEPFTQELLDKMIKEVEKLPKPKGLILIPGGALFEMYEVDVDILREMIFKRVMKEKKDQITFKMEGK